MLSRIRKNFLFTLWSFVHTAPIWYIRRWQQYRFKKIARHALRSVPYFTERTLSSGLSHAALLNQFPILNRSVYAADFTRMLSSSFTPADYVLRYTSGSTGKPLKAAFHINELLMPYNRYANHLRFRFMVWAGYDFTYVLQEAKILLFRVDSALKTPRLSLSITDLHERPEEMLQTINSYQPVVIESFTSTLVRLAHIVSESDYAGKISTTYAVSMGEVMTGEQRSFIEKHLGCEVYDRYGLKELGAIASECRYHNGLHINSESFIVEILDEQDAPVVDGTDGRIVITNLMNYAMPFIRYDTGDRGRMLTGTCPCGLQTPRIIVSGREGLFVELSGKKFHEREFKPAFNTSEEWIQQYQVVKTEASHLVIDIVLRRQPTDAEQQHTHSTIQRLVGNGVHISLHFVDAIDMQPWGKNQILVDRSHV